MNENTNSQNSANENLNSENQNNENSNSQNANENTNSKTVPLSSLLDERKKRQSLEAEIEKFRKEKEDAETQKKLAEGKKDEVIMELTEKLKSKEKEFEPFIEKAKKYDEYDKAKRETLKEVLKDNWMESFDTMPLMDVEKIASKLTHNVKLPDADNGTNKSNPTKEIFSLEELKKLTPEQLRDKDILKKANKSMEYHARNK